MRAPCEEWELAGPAIHAGVAGWKRATAGRPRAPAVISLVVESSPSGAVEIEVAGPSEAEIQVTVVPLGADLPRLDLAVSKVQGPGRGTSAPGGAQRSETACPSGSRLSRGSP